MITPHRGQRRRPAGGLESKVMGWGMTHSLTDTGGSAMVSQPPTPAGNASVGDVER
jgi:hypothetical protein